uniref:Macaca fascicularis brain cDNA, clone: QmoA-11549 n=1 Tax=Macaca fascicularis TaxID=9541 RepID=I7GN65_MACFA|nr:unnamed protein product [Macaca fascicularis]
MPWNMVACYEGRKIFYCWCFSFLIPENHSGAILIQLYYFWSHQFAL